MSYLGDCRRRRIVKVIEGPVPEIYEGGKWRPLHVHRGRVARPRWNRSPTRYRFRFKLWPCRHEVTFRMRQGDFPSRAMAREPFAIAAWIGRDCPCYSCGPAKDPQGSFRDPAGRRRGFELERRRPKRKLPKPTGSDPADLSPAELYCELEKRDRAICRELAAMYDS